MKRLLKTIRDFIGITAFVFLGLSIICSTFAFGNLEYLCGAFGIAMFIGFILAFNE